MMKSKTCFQNSAAEKKNKGKGEGAELKPFSRMTGALH